MALAAVATLAVSAVAAPAPAHAQRYLGAAVAGGLIGGAIVGGAIAAGPAIMDTAPAITDPATVTTAVRPMSRRRDPMAGLLLAAAAFLGRLWLADSQRPGLRLIPFIFVKTQRPGNRAFPGTLSILA